MTLHPDLTFTVDVTLTDRMRNADGTYRTYLARVTVLAQNDTEARLIAIQMATAIRSDLDVMPLGDRLVDVVA